MTGVLTLLAAGLASWLLRVALITIVPADRLPERLRRLLPHVDPAVLAALIAGSLVHGGGLPGLLVPTPRHLALLAAAWWPTGFRTSAASMAAALLVMVAAGLLPT